MSLDGMAVLDKPAGWTSHDVVARARRLLGTRKVGHSGTLDPDATGVLLLGIGRATRLLRYLTALGKTYDCEIVLGAATDTLDDSGTVVATAEMSDVTAEQVAAAAGALTGDLLQVPPMVSAVKVGGRRLHELAREGREVEREARPVTVHRFVVTPAGEDGVYRAEVACSSGTYVRSLAADLGEALGGYAHLRHLRRTAVGGFTLADAVPLEDLTPDVVLPPAAAMRGRPAVTVDEAGLIEVGHGRPLRQGLPAGMAVGEPVAVLDGSGRLVAVYEATGPDGARASVVLAPAGQ